MQLSTFGTKEIAFDELVLPCGSCEVPAYCEPREIIERLRAAGLPVVSLGFLDEGYPNIERLMLDACYRTGAKKVRTTRSPDGRTILVEWK